MKRKVAVFVGRFQPIHNGHLEIIKLALKENDKLLLFVGSAPTSISTKNPFTFEERVDMITQSLPHEELKRIVILPIKDFFYVENGWMRELQKQVCNNTTSFDTITLYGHYKDSTSYYLNWFPQWNLRTCPKYADKINASDIRELMYLKKEYKSHEIGRAHV